MPFNILDSVNNLFTTDLIGKAAATLGEGEDRIEKAVSAVVPSVLTGILNKVGSGRTVASNLFDMAKQASGSGVLGNLGNLLAGSGSGTGLSGLLNMASSVFGDKLGAVTSQISGFAGIKPSSASALLNITTPAALGVIGKHVTQNNMDSNGFISMLVNQKDKILSAIPSGLGIAGALGLGSLNDIGKKLSSVVTGISTQAGRGMRWIPAVLLVVLAAGLLWFLSRDRNTKIPATETSISNIPAPTSTPAATLPSIKVRLPNGVELDALRGGIEDKLVTFLNDPNSIAGKDVWFDFDNLNFETGSATITAESKKQVNNIAQILKAYPKTKIKIGGYTDKTGDEGTNKRLSQQRAESVTIALKIAGANGTQLLAPEGYGSDFAKVPATASDEERKPDRRISVSVREK